MVSPVSELEQIPPVVMPCRRMQNPASPQGFVHAACMQAHHPICGRNQASQPAAADRVVKGSSLLTSFLIKPCRSSSHCRLSLRHSLTSARLSYPEIISQTTFQNVILACLPWTFACSKPLVSFLVIAPCLVHPRDRLPVRALTAPRMKISRLPLASNRYLAYLHRRWPKTAAIFHPIS